MSILNFLLRVAGLAVVTRYVLFKDDLNEKDDESTSKEFAKCKCCDVLCKTVCRCCDEHVCKKHSIKRERWNTIFRNCQECINKRFEEKH